MECERCGAKATVHITRVENGIKQERHLCEKCARELFGFEFKESMAVGDAMTGILELMKEDQKAARLMDAPACPSCGMTFKGFKTSGKLGCPRCYRQFSEQLGPILLRIHKSAEHIGKMPPGQMGGRRIEREIVRRRRAMKEAVASEDFETAAKLRDEIKALEAKRD